MKFKLVFGIYFQVSGEELVTINAEFMERKESKEEE
jgi:hypothetical protein